MKALVKTLVCPACDCKRKATFQVASNVYECGDCGTLFPRVPLKHDHPTCKVVVEDWPYECEAKDKHPDHMVFACVTHGAWWHEGVVA